MKKLMTWLLVVVAGLFAFGCGGDGSDGGGSNTSTTTTVTEATLQTVTTTPTTASIATATTRQFTATGSYSDGTSQDLSALVTWSSSATSVATISASGLATGISAGTATITATSGSISGSATLTVTEATLQTVTTTPTTASIATATTRQFTATGSYSDGTSQDLSALVTWSSSATSVATISASGLATGISAGTATITATSGSLSGSATLTVTNFTATVLLATGTVFYGEANGYSGLLSQDLATGAITVLWSSSAVPIFIAPSGDGSKIALGGSNMSGIYLYDTTSTTVQQVTSNSALSSGCSADTTFAGFGLSLSGDVAVVKAHCSTIGLPSRYDLFAVMTDGSGQYFRITDDDAIEMSPVIGSGGDASSQLTIYFVNRNSSDAETEGKVWKQAIDPSNNAIVGSPELITTGVDMSNWSEHRHMLSINATYDKIAFMKVGTVVVKDLISGVETSVDNGYDPRWTSDGRILYSENTLTTGNSLWVINPDGTGKSKVPISDGLTVSGGFIPRHWDAPILIP